MANGVNIGFLNFGIDGEDNPLRNKLANLKEESIELDKILSNLTIGSTNKTTGFDNVLKSQAETAIQTTKAISKSMESISKVDFSSNIDQLLSKLKEVRGDMTALKELMSETQNANKKLEIRNQYEQASQEAEKLMRQMSALDEAQNKLNTKGSIIPTRNMGDDRALKQMAEYYRDLEKTSVANAKAQEKAKKDADKLAKIKERASRQATELEARENAKQLALQEKKARESERIARQTAEAQRKAAERITIEQQRINATIGLTNKTMFSQKELLSQMSNALGIYFSIYQAGSFVKELAMISGEFEKQRLSLAAILQNKQAADKIFAQIRDLAVYSPFNFKELNDYAKQLSAFSIPTNELFGTMKNLADISAGLGVDMSRIILAYGQVRSASVLRGQELRQFTEAGIPMVDELAKKFSELEGRVVSAGEVFDKISQRQVPFAMVKDIFEDLTAEGGKFYQMQEIQATSLAGMISNLRDAYDIMLDSIGSSYQGILKGAVSGMVDVMDNWERFANILKSIIAIYGTYKAGIIVINALHGTENRMMIQSVMANKAKEASLLRQAAAYRTLTAVEKMKIATSAKLTSADLKQMVVSGQLTKENALRLIATKQITVAQAGHLKTSLGITKAQIAQAASTSALSKSMLVMGTSVRAVGTAISSLALNPYTWVLLAIGGIVYALGEWNDKQREVDETAKSVAGSVQESYKKISKAIEKLNPKIEVALSGVGTENSIKQAIQSVLQTLENNVPEDIFSNIVGNTDKIPVAADKLKYLQEVLNDVHKSAEAVNGSIEIFTKNALNSVDGYFDDGLITNLKDYDKWFKDYKSIKNKIEQGILDEGFIMHPMRGMSREKQALDEDLSGFISSVKQSLFPNITDWANDPNLDMGSQAIVVQLRDNLLNGITNLSPEIEKEIVSLFNKEFYISPKIVIDKDIATPLQEAIEKSYKSLSNPENQIALNTVMSNQDENMLSWIERTRTTYAKAKEERDQYNKSLAKGVELLPNIDYQNKIIKTLEGLSKTMGFDLDKKTKTPKKEKDPYIEKLKKRIELLKKAKSAYDELLKVESKANAQSSFQKLDAYKSIDINTLSESGYKQAIDTIIKELEDKGKKLSESGKTLLHSLILGQTDTTLKDITQKAKKEIEKIEKELSEYKVQYSFYEQLFKLTGDKGKAAKAVFGIGNALDGVKQQMTETFGNGNVDLLSRPLVEASKLVEKGWLDAGEGIATVFSSQYGIMDASGSKREILITPILPDGSVLTQNELDDYIYNILEGSQDILAADSKGIVISIDVDENGAAGEILHQLQEAYYSASYEVLTYSDALKKAFQNLGGISFSDFIKLELSQKDEHLLNEGLKKIYNLIETAEKEEEKRENDIYTSSLKSHLSNEEKRLAITKEYDEKIAIAKEKGNHALAAKLATGKDSELMKLTPEYDKFFTSIYSLTGQEALKIGNLIKKNLKEQLDKGVISTKDYYDGIKKINKELEKSGKGLKLFEKLQSGGLNGLLDGLKEKADSDLFSATKDLELFTEQYNAALEKGDTHTASLAQNNMKSAEGSMAAAEGMQGFAGAAQGAVGMVDMIVTAIDNSVKATQQLVDQFATLAESRGIDTDDGTWADVKGAMSVLSAVNAKGKAAWDSVKGGDGVGAAVNTIGMITDGLTAINKWHDSKLDKTIQKSQFEVKKLQLTYAELERVVTRQLGAVTKTQAQEQITNLEKQRAELEKQIQAEQDKKKTNHGAVEDYKAQINELNDTIRYFYEDLAGEQFDIKIRDWANTIAGSLVDAWSQGEDAAKAFDKTVANIMRNVFKNVLQLQYIEPAMENLRTYLFGTDGKGGILGDGEMSAGDMNGLVHELAKMRNKIGEWEDAWDYLAQAASQAGIDLEEGVNKDTLSKGIQSITEDTAHLLGSYINSIRANTSKQLVFVERLVALSDKNSNTFALQLASLKKIEANTGRSADGTERILDILKKVTLSGSGIKLNV